MQSITLFKQFTKVVEHQTIPEIIKRIRDGAYQTKISTIRKLILDGRKEEAQQKKKQLLAFTVSGKFEGGRKLEHLQEYRPYIILDIDQLPDQKRARKIQLMASKLPYTYASFLSPSGVGVKIILEVDTGIELHQLAYEQVATYYETALEIEVDRSGKDISRLCYVSYDPDAYLNEMAKPYPVKREQPNRKITSQLDDCLARTSFLSKYQPGNRNNFIYLFAINCNRVGIPLEVTQDYCQQQFDLPIEEMRATIRSAYSHTAGINDQEAMNEADDDLPIEEQLLNTPTLPDEIFNNLPGILKESCAIFTNKRERDVFLTSALAILSGCISHIYGLYHGQRIFPNLYTLILAPAASGKSAINYARIMVEEYEKELKEQNEKERNTYKIALRDYQKALHQGEEEIITADPPEKPPIKMLFVPANSSSSKIIKHLAANEGQAIICETEADTLGNVLKQDWGGYSDLLRKAFSGETISQSRRAEDEYASIKDARLSIALTGTPRQILQLTPSPEDGLFSRFLFYTFNTEPIWEDVSPQNQKADLYRHFESQSKEVLQMIRYLDKLSTNFQLQLHHWHYLNQYFQQELTKAHIIYGQGAEATIKRGGNILFRIAMVLSACRQYETKHTSDQYICQEADFQIAFQLVDTYIKHALFLLEKLPQTRGVKFNRLPNNKRAFLEALPQTFKRGEAIALGVQFSLKTRTIDRFLKKLLGIALEQREYGSYQKIKVERSSL